MERTFVMIKPDAVVRGLMGEIISRIEKKGLKIVAMKLHHLTEEEAKELYKPHEGKHFFNDLIEFVRSAPVVLMAVEGESAISVMRRLLGSTDAKEAAPGTIRGDFSCSKSMNLVHASDSPESASRELTIFFKEEDYLKYRRVDEDWVY
ncbi:MAG: nucleoside-diphosphate kinase [Candidatus Verstraetearchaeota archaeon]|nr:nucleoside-diphosphate kinase [Candidatus Verstraetearchaeota archaeon]